MKSKHFLFRGWAAFVAFSAGFLALACLPASLHAQGQGVKKKNPSSKIYVSDVSGEAQIDTGDSVQDLGKRSVYDASGTVIETKKAEKAEDNAKVFSTMVYSNGTGVYFDHDTRVEVKRFVQEPFKPNRTDMEVEPSISQTQAFVAHGTVGLCNSKLVAGSSMVYNTPHGGINIRGQKVVIEATDNETKVSMLDGDSTVRGGDMDLGGHTLKSGEQAIIRPGPPGQPNIVSVAPIPASETSSLDDKVAMACMAKKTVYFEVKQVQVGTRGALGSTAAETGAGGNGPVVAFDGTSANSNQTSSTATVGEIVPVEVVPTTLPVQFTVSPAVIVSKQPGSG